MKVVKLQQRGILCASGTVNSVNSNLTGDDAFDYEGSDFGYDGDAR